MTDPLSTELITKLDDAKSPIWADALPSSAHSKYLQISKLDQLEELKIAGSDLARHGNALVRKFSITPFGHRVATLLKSKG